MGIDSLTRIGVVTFKRKTNASTLELSEKYVQKKKLRANFIKIGISNSQETKSSLVVVLKQV
jgi:hypothetical protein